MKRNKEYKKWAKETKKRRPELTDEQIRQLYEQMIFQAS